MSEEPTTGAASPVLVKPRAFSATTRNRLNEHGATWAVVRPSEPVSFATDLHSLLQSVATGHQRWWPDQHLAAI